MFGSLLRRRAVAVQDTPYITGVNSPMHAELVIEDLEVIGTIPAALRGRYLRMGPNPMNPSPRRHHWFAGDGMIHGIRIEHGRALWYRNRWIRSNAVSDALGEARTPGPRHLFDTVNTNVTGYGGTTFGLIEAGSTPVVIGETLETERYADFAGTLHGGLSAHPHVDPLTGEMLAVSYDAAKWRTIRYLAIGPDGRVRREVKVPVRHGPMLHDFASRRGSRSCSTCRSPSRSPPPSPAINSPIAGMPGTSRASAYCRATAMPGR